MTGDSEADRALGRQGRIVALVIAGTMILWFVAQSAGAWLGLAGRYAFLVDLFALAGFLWALIVTWRIWRRRRNMR